MSVVLLVLLLPLLGESELFRIDTLRGFRVSPFSISYSLYTLVNGLYTNSNTIPANAPPRVAPTITDQIRESSVYLLGSVVLNA